MIKHEEEEKKIMNNCINRPDEDNFECERRFNPEYNYCKGCKYYVPTRWWHYLIFLFFILCSMGMILFLIKVFTFCLSIASRF